MQQVDDDQNEKLIDSNIGQVDQNHHARPGDKSKWGKDLVQLTFTNVIIKTDPPTRKCGRAIANPLPSKTIINGVSGTIMPGQFVAIIGASGAGKTTLLNFLSGRDFSQGLLKSGEVSVNGLLKEKFNNYSAFSAYVQQDDILFQTMTVRECLEFAAKLKLKGTLESKIQRVDELIATLKLNKCQNTQIGGPLVKGVSGGERKRCAVGVELITDPSLIFLDEPTTGLDSFIATQVMDNLRDLAMTYGKTVISTIHQPNSDIYDMFDRLLLMAAGKIIYFNEAKFAIDYFGSIQRQCPELTNPADYFMTIMSIEGIDVEQLMSEPENRGKNPDDVLKEEYKDMIQYYDESYINSHLRNKHDEISDDVDEIALDGDQGKLTTGFCFQFALLTKRNFMNLIRLPQTSYVKLLTTCLTAGFAILLFYDVEKTPEGVQDIQGALFFITMNIAFNAVQNVILIFPDERPVFLREVNNNMYSTAPYFWAKIISEMPFALMTPVIFGCIVYYAIGLNDEEVDYFFIFILILILIYNSSSGYSLIISASISDKQLAVTLTPVLIIPFMLFAGFFVSTDNIPNFLKEFEYLSIFKYGYNALLLNQFQVYLDGGPDMDDTFPCIFDGTCDPLSQITNDDGDVPDKWASILALLGLYVGCYMIAWIILSLLARASE